MTAVNRGIEACRKAARPESSFFSLHASSQNGSPALKTPTSSSGRQKRRSPAQVGPQPPRNHTAGSSPKVPTRTRPKTTSPGVTSRTATLMNRKEEPQMAARASSIGSGRRLTAGNRTRGLSGRPVTLDPLTQVAPEQPLHRALGLTDEELDRIRELLGRNPNDFELTVFSLLWSEHCGYKHSALLLKRLPSTGERVLQGPGENAGVIDLGDGEAVAFKVESHNHPSAVEPFQGAAKGVGGILRDILAMGARPIAFLDGLRFGSPDHRFERAVEGIGHYGNSCGVSTVGGEAVFDAAYEDNCLVNAMCVGLLPVDRVTRAGARGTGNALVLYGATTGRDGIGGASVLASQELGEGTGEKRPSVQIGDPFTGKKLIEASGELVERSLVESLQDCGAAGLASSLAEMARDAGIDVRLDLVPLREDNLEPWEVMISESQERMVAVVSPERLDDVFEVCSRWELAYAVVGEVTDTGELRCFDGDDLLAAIPASALTEEAPRYRVPQVARDPQPPAPPVDGPPAADALVDLLGSPNLRSRAWIYRRYDHLVG